MFLQVHSNCDMTAPHYQSMYLSILGFSFGGLLACGIVAKLWQAALDPGLLQRNLCCITFGQPIIAISSVQRAFQMFPYLQNTIHLIYDKEDVIPALIQYHSVGCTIYGTQLIQGQSKQSDSALNLERKCTVVSVVHMNCSSGMIIV